MFKKISISSGKRTSDKDCVYEYPYLLKLVSGVKLFC